jgi:PPOX class probable FMN-dependent enzyme
VWTDPVTSEAELRALLGEPGEGAVRKQIDVLDDHARDFIARSPFFVLATGGPDGTSDASPRGGPPGCVQVLDDRRLAFADYSGNRRADSHLNLLARPGVGLVFFIPGLGETLRVNGRATPVRDPGLLAALPTGGRPPRLAVGVEVEAVYLHCAKAFRRSGLWDPATWPDELPSAARILRAHAAVEADEAQVAAGLERSYAERLW